MRCKIKEVMGSLHVRIPPPWNHHVRRLHNQEPQRPLCHFPSASLSKQGQRLLRSLAVTRDSKTANRLISKFVASSPQFIALNALSHLLSPHPTHPHHLSSLALPVSHSSFSQLHVKRMNFYIVTPSKLLHFFFLSCSCT